ncbi:SAM-dependent methyltransferase [Jiangella endophytica]|uniref:SAM-dependent methyltransferase n=1 Tax=Jiangella endophytica TaxID=1623398 RepID=UPI000E349068|nr:class I SAM-dependent methyltransferase [Jiangella endophytica]
MTDPPVPPFFDDADFNSPLSDERAGRLVASLGPLAHRRVVDLGCGWGELLLRVLEAEPAATGLGVDLDAAAVDHARANAARRGLDGRVTFLAEDAGRHLTEPADVVINIGSSHIWGDLDTDPTAAALKAIRAILPTGGRLLLGEMIWTRDPTADELTTMGMERDQCRSLPDLVDTTIGLGYRPLDLSQATLDEWDRFESLHALGWEHWLLENPGSPDAPEIRRKADEHRRRWLHGWRGPLGFGYLTLAAAP